MEYTDNPRKILGRVDVIYSDTEISKDIQTTESGNSAISHPDEVFGAYLVPTVKGCTMDGNATMDGSFQMMDDSVVLGWWSGSLSGSNGVLANAPWIEISFVKRPIISWVVLGDEKRNEYPVDFILQYKRDGKIVHSDSVTVNNQIQVRLTPQLEDITSIRLTITKWSKPNACVKILKFYDRMMERYEGDAIEMFEVSEEMGAADGNYNIVSDTMTVNIFNKGRKFDKGYLRSLMILDRKLLPSIGIETDGEVKYQPLGTFYSDEWQINQDSQWVKCSAVDRLMRLQKKTYVGFPLTENASLYDIAADILLNIGETADTFVISNDLKSVIVPMAFLPKGTAWDALQEIANAGLCKVFVDREDKINVRSEKEPKTTTAIRIDKSNMFSYSSSVSLTEFANRISVEYCDVSLSNDTVEAVSVELNIEPNVSLELTLDYNTEVAYPAMGTDNLNVLLTDFQGGVNACSVVAKNKTAEKQKAVLTVTGKAIEITTKSLTMQDDDSVRNNGVTEYSHPSSDLVQSHAQAEYIARILLERMHAGEGVITTTWRGNPKLNLGEKYESADRFGDSQELVCEYNKFTFDGGLKQETRGRTI